MGISYQLLSMVSAVRVIKKRKKEKKRARPNSALSYSPAGEEGEGGGKKRGGELAETKLRPLLPFFTGIGLPA